MEDITATHSLKSICDREKRRRGLQTPESPLAGISSCDSAERGDPGGYYPTLDSGRA